MILVDTSVWIDFFRGTESPQAQRLEHAIRDRENLALCGTVLTETLQGIRDDAQYQRVRQYLKPLILLLMDERIFTLAADPRAPPATPCSTSSTTPIIRRNIFPSECCARRVYRLLVFLRRHASAVYQPHV